MGFIDLLRPRPHRPPDRHKKPDTGSAEIEYALGIDMERMEPKAFNDLGPEAQLVLTLRMFHEGGTQACLFSAMLPEGRTTLYNTARLYLLHNDDAFIVGQKRVPLKTIENQHIPWLDTKYDGQIRQRDDETDEKFGHNKVAVRLLRADIAMAKALGRIASAELNKHMYKLQCNGYDLYESSGKEVPIRSPHTEEEKHAAQLQNKKNKDYKILSGKLPANLLGIIREGAAKGHGKEASKETIQR